MSVIENADNNKAPADPNEGAPARSASVHALISRLLQCHRDYPVDTGRVADPHTVATLILAEAAVRDLSALEHHPQRPAQIAVLGPTQAGKSTVVNLLCGAHLAPVSPLAGFTVHPNALALAPSDPEFSWLEGFFPDWERRPADRLSGDRLDCYAVTAVPLSAERARVLPVDCVVWDTPDFDSLKARSYQRGVLEVAALADVVVLVLSREKYADLSVWTTLRLLDPLRRPLIVCLNKVTNDAEAILLASLRKHLHELNARHEDAPVVTLPLQPGLHELAEDRLPAGVNVLREKVVSALRAADRGNRRVGALELLQEHWEQWTAPINREIDAQKEWCAAVEQAIQAALSAYQIEFLDHPQRFDTFRRVVVELLELLELPGLARSLAHVRKVLTWPARQLMSAYQKRRRKRRLGRGAMHDLANEELVLEDLVEQLLTRLSRDVARRCDSNTVALPFWRALNERLATDHGQLGAKFRQAAHQHHVAFAPEVQEAARRLYAVLQEKPALLNTLRATRASADAAAVVVALKTGGIGLNDLLFAPALVSLTSMLAEGAVGSYVKREADELKRRQYAAAEQHVFRAVVQPALTQLVNVLEAPGLFGVSAAELEAAESSLAEWAHG